MTIDESSNVRILERYPETAGYLPEIVAAADAHRDLLGFTPRTVLQEYARQNELLVLVLEVDGKWMYAGHLMFARRHPRAKVMQLLVLPEYRRRNFGRVLTNRLMDLLTAHGFTSIYARVGEDMRTANDAWQALGFRVQRTEPGGVTTGRTIVVRVKELDGPQLFPIQGVDPADPLGLSRSISTEVPLFLIDLNVLFDLSPRRARHDDALNLFQAERANFCKLAVSDEMIDELARTGHSGRPDPMMNLARTFTRFPVSDVGASAEMVAHLARLVFPAKDVTALSPNERSDIRHLLTAVENNLAGLLTNDEAILTAAKEIEKQFGVQVLSPKVFIPDESNRAIAAYQTSHADLELIPLNTNDGPELRRLLTKLGLTPADLASGWSGTASTCFVVRCASKIVAFVSWPVLRHDGTVTVRAAIDETVLNAVDVARGVLTHSLTLIVDGPTRLRLKTPANQVFTREIAMGLGFRGKADSSDLTKLAFGRVATKGNWQTRRAELADTCGLKLEGQLPMYRRNEQQVPYSLTNGAFGYETLESMEDLLSPALFCFPGRPAVITPILHKYSQLLLGHSRQASLLPATTAQLFQERHYISGPNAFTHLKRGTLMFFYESNPPRGRGELVAVSRVRRSYLKDVSDLGSQDFTQSVLDSNSVSAIGRAELKCVTVFDSVFALPLPISLDRLQQLGCGQPNDLITTRRISDTQIQAILAEAFKL